MDALDTLRLACQEILEKLDLDEPAPPREDKTDIEGGLPT